jgi:hypothetical protein
MEKFFDKFETLKGVSFVNLANYESSTSGEIANHIININLSVMNAKKKDFETLKSVDEKKLFDISEKSGIALDICKIALSEMITSAEKNLNEDPEQRTNQSKGQTDAYIHLTPAIKMHKETMDVHVFGQHIQKTVIKKGEYKTVKSQPKTLAKKAITKEMNLSAPKFRNFKVGNIDKISISGETLELKK